MTNILSQKNKIHYYSDVNNVNVFFPHRFNLSKEGMQFLTFLISYTRFNFF